MTQEEFDNLVPGMLISGRNLYSIAKIYTRVISKNVRHTDGNSYDGSIWGIWYRDKELTGPLHNGEILFMHYSDCEILEKRTPIESDPEYEDLFI